MSHRQQLMSMEGKSIDRKNFNEFRVALSEAFDYFENKPRVFEAFIIREHLKEKWMSGQNVAKKQRKP